jgi:hypothetical protein
LGNPVIEGVYGSTGLFYNALFMLPVRVVVWTVGISVFLKGEKVNLFWDGYLYNAGTINGNYAGDSNENYKSGSNGATAKNTNNITLSQSSGGQTINHAFENKVDLTKINKIILKGTIKCTNASSSALAQIGISSENIGSVSIESGCEKYTTSPDYKNTAYVNFTLEMDVSEVTGEKYVYYGLKTGAAVGGAYGWMVVTEVYVE